MGSYYDLLGVAPDASTETIRKAFRRKVVHVHPDKNARPDAAFQFYELHQAYETLINPSKRIFYDLNLRRDPNAMPDWDEYKKQVQAQEEERARKEHAEFIQKRTVLHAKPWFVLYPSYLYLQLFLGSLTGFGIIGLCIWIVFQSHWVVSFVLLPFILLGGYIIRLSVEQFYRLRKFL
jgi:hypothetical protein